MGVRGIGTRKNYAFIYIFFYIKTRGKISLMKGCYLPHLSPVTITPEDKYIPSK